MNYVHTRCKRGQRWVDAAKRRCATCSVPVQRLVYPWQSHAGWLSSNVLRVGKKCSAITKVMNTFEVISFSPSTITMIFVVFCSWGYLFLYRRYISTSIPSFSSTQNTAVARQPATSTFAQLRPPPYRTTAQYSIS